MALALELRQRGHEVAIYTGHRARAAIEGEGFRHFPFQDVDEARLFDLVYPSGRVLRAWRHPGRFVSVLEDWLVGTIPDQIRDLEHVLDAWRADAVISDVSMWGPPLVLHEQRGLPVAVSSYAPGCMIPGPGLPPWGLGLPRPRSWTTRALSWAVGLLTRAQVAGLRRHVDAVRARYRLPAIDAPVHAFLGRLPLYLVPSTPELDYPRHDLPPSVHYVGPLIWNRPSREPPPPWLTQLSRDRPLVHVSEGTMHGARPFLLDATVRGLGGSAMQVVMTSGDRDPGALGLGPLPDNVRLERWVPHADLLPLTDVVVTTGGAGVVLTALQAGVPMVVVPTEWDKPDNAQRVVEAGAGLRLSVGRCTPARLRRSVERVLREPSFRSRAQRLRECLRERGGPKRAADLLEALCGVRDGASPWAPRPSVVGPDPSPVPVASRSC